LRRAAAGAFAVALAVVVPDALAAGHSLRFFGAGAGDVDRVKIRIDDPANALPGPPADVGATDFTIEFWLKASAAENTAGAAACGPNNDWIAGNIVVDRDTLSNDRKYGISIAGGKIVFGVSGDGTGTYSLCSLSSVLDGAWHHVAAQRRRSDGFLWLFIDGNLEAQILGPGGDISYPDAAAPVNSNEPYLVLGAEKFDRGGALGLAYSGWLDELRISTKLRYTASFSRPRAPFVADRFTAALYHFDEGDGATLYDVSGAFHSPSPGQIKRGGVANGPAWMPDSPFNVGGLVNNATIALVPFVPGFSSPVDLVNAGDGSGRLYVIQQGGLIRIIRNGVILAPAFLNIAAKTVSGGEQGLLGLAFHPNYGVNGFFYVYYTRAGDGALTIERYKRDANNTNLADPTSAKTMLTIPHPGQSNHNGGKLAFGHDGYLYAGTGDGGGGNDVPNNAQNLKVRLGKLLRLDVDQNVNVAPYYGIPPTNPFAGNVCDGTSNIACSEIWAYGLRNPWRWNFDRVTGDLLIGDVGQNDREEIDFDPWPGTPARNYGWRIMEGNICTPGVGSPCTPPPDYVPPIID
jgi:glucose/arabinose dehydrogenase